MKKSEPSAVAVAEWLKDIDHHRLQGKGWVEVNIRFPGIARAALPFFQMRFPDEKDQEAALEGLTLALLAVTHFDDIEQLLVLFEAESVPEE